MESRAYKSDIEMAGLGSVQSGERESAFVYFRTPLVVENSTKGGLYLVFDRHDVLAVIIRNILIYLSRMYMNNALFVIGYPPSRYIGLG
jgi:hypothetical protein